MKCFNCGNELKDGTLVCPRCGKRQPGGGGRSGGSGGSGGSNGKGGFGAGKIVALVASILVVVGLSIFGINHFRNSNGSQFTHDTTFEKDNLTVTEDHVLRYREVKNTKTFNVGSKNPYADVKILDENDNAVDFQINQIGKSNKYKISPKGKWDNTHTYYMSLGEGTYFSDEDMYSFNKLIYTIEKENIANYTINKNIIELSENPTYEVKIGDVVGYEDSNGVKKYGKAVLKNGVIAYEDASLVDLFEELDLVGDFAPDYSKIEWNNDGTKEFLYDIQHSEFFLDMVKTVYATDVKYEVVDGIEAIKFTGALGFNVKSIPIKDICKIDIGLKVETEKKNFFKDIDSTIGNNEVLVLKLEFEFNPLDGKLFGNSVADDTTVVIELTKKMGVVVKSNVDIKWLTVNSFDFQMLNYCEDSFNIEVKWETKYKNDEFESLIDIQAGQNVSSQIKGTVDADKKPLDGDFNLLSIGENKLETKKIYSLFNVPIQTPIPFVHVDVTVDINGNFKAEAKADYNYSCISKSKTGIEYNNKTGELSYTKIFQKTGSIELVFEGEMDARIGVSPQVHLAVGIASYNPVKAGFGFETGVYMKAQGKLYFNHFNVNEKEKTTVNSKQQVDPQYDFYMDPSAGIEGSIEAGLYVQLFVDGEINIIKPILRAKYYFLNEEYPFVQQSGEVKLNKDGFTATHSSIRIGQVGSQIDFGPYKFVVLDKDESKGIALITTIEGIDARPYVINENNTDMSISYTWEGSTLRKYLNNEFIKKFSRDEIDSIYEYVVKAEKNSKYGIDGGKDTKDYVFILSKSELEKYFKSDSDRQLKASGTAIAAGAYVSKETDKDRHRQEGYTIYWVRNPGNMNIYAMAVNSDGSINEEGAPVAREDICVRPAIWVRDQFYEMNVRRELADAWNGVVDLPNTLLR